MDSPAPETQGSIRIDAATTPARAVLSGRLGIRDLPRLRDELATVPPARRVTFDLAGAERVDTSIAWEIGEAARARPGTEVTGAAGPVAQILKTVEEGLPTPDDTPPPPRGFRVWVEGVGETSPGSARPSSSSPHSSASSSRASAAPSSARRSSASPRSSTIARRWGSRPCPSWRSWPS